MSIDRQKILKQLARVMNQVAESEETVAGTERPWLNWSATVRMSAWH